MMDNWHLTGEWIIDIQKSYDWSIQYYGSWDRIQNGFSVYSILSTMLVWRISVLTWSWYWINSFSPTWPVTKSFPPGNTSLPSPPLTPDEELSMSPSSNMEYIMQGGFRNGSHGMMNYLTYNIFISELYFSVFKRIFSGLGLFNQHLNGNISVLRKKFTVHWYLRYLKHTQEASHIITPSLLLQLHAFHSSELRIKPQSFYPQLLYKIGKVNMFSDLKYAKCIHCISFKLDALLNLIPADGNWLLVRTGWVCLTISSNPICLRHNTLINNTLPTSPHWHHYPHN